MIFDPEFGIMDQEIAPGLERMLIEEKEEENLANTSFIKIKTIIWHENRE